MFFFGHQLIEPTFYGSYRKALHNTKRSFDDLVKEQELCLRNMIEYSYRNIPYYNALFKQLNLYPTDITTITDLEKLPILTKDIINDNWESFKPIKLEKMKYITNSTGGTTGTPMKYRLSGRDRFLGAAIMYRGWGYAGYKLADKMVFLAGSSLGISTNTNYLTRINEFVRNIKKLSSFEMGNENLHKYVKIIKSFKPKYLQCYPSSAHYFANWLEENSINITGIEAIFTTADQLFPNMREKIEDVFSCPVFDGYGLNDGGVSAYECEEHFGYHIDMERSVMEFVDDTSTQLENGEGKILATSLFNYALPFIRYDTGDLGILSDEKCSCERPFPIMKELRGRSVDFFITPEGKRVHGWFFLYILWKYDKGIVQYQVVQESLCVIVIYLIIKENFDRRQLSRIEQIIKSKSENWHVEFKYVDKIPTSKSGKHKFIINKIDDKQWK